MHGCLFGLSWHFGSLWHQEALDLIEQKVAEARETTREAVSQPSFRSNHLRVQNGGEKYSVLRWWPCRALRLLRLGEMEGQRKFLLYTKGFHTVSISIACEAAVACDNFFWSVQKLRQLLWPAAGLVMLGGLVFFTCPAGAPLLCAAGRGSKKKTPLTFWWDWKKTWGVEVSVQVSYVLAVSRLGTN